MSDLLFEINESEPEWKILQSQHGIETRQIFEDGIPVAFAAWIPGRQCETTTDETERGAVVSLIHILKLDGWQRISMNP
jgi:hypothetical protein